MFKIGTKVKYDSDLGYNCDDYYIVMAASITQNTIFYQIQNLNNPRDIHNNIEEYFLYDSDAELAGLEDIK